MHHWSPWAKLHMVNWVKASNKLQRNHGEKREGVNVLKNIQTWKGYDTFYLLFVDN